MKKVIYIGGDHAGFNLKEKIKTWLIREGNSVKDIGPFRYDKHDDYPDYTIPLAESVSKHRDSYGIVIAGSGIGETIAANKVNGIRAVLYHSHSPKLITTSKIHDNANILCLGSRFLNEKEIKSAIKLWLRTSFTGEKRHKRRLGKITKYENKRKV